MPENEPGSFPEDSAAAEKNAADKTLGNRASVRCGREPLRTRRGISPDRGNPSGCGWLPQPTGGLPLCYGLQRLVFFRKRAPYSETLAARPPPPSKMIAEGKRGRRFYERLPRTVLNLLQYADGLKRRRRRLQRPLFPALVPARSMACSMLSVVNRPKPTGTPLSRDTWARPLVASAATKSK